VALVHVAGAEIDDNVDDEEDVDEEVEPEPEQVRQALVAKGEWTIGIVWHGAKGLNLQ
jgi:hypothetical protein